MGRFKRLFGKNKEGAAPIEDIEAGIEVANNSANKSTGTSPKMASPKSNQHVTFDEAYPEFDPDRPETGERLSPNGISSNGESVESTTLTLDTRQSISPVSALGQGLKLNGYKFLLFCLWVIVFFGVCSLVYYFIVPLLSKSGAVNFSLSQITVGSHPTDEQIMLMADVQVQVPQNPMSFLLRSMQADLKSGGRTAGRLHVPAFDVQGSTLMDFSMKTAFEIVDEPLFESILVRMIRDRQAPKDVTIAGRGRLAWERLPFIGLTVKLERPLDELIPEDMVDAASPLVAYKVLRFDLGEGDGVSGLRVDLDLGLTLDTPFSASLPIARFDLYHSLASGESVRVGSVETTQAFVVQRGESVMHLQGHLRNPSEDALVAASVSEIIGSVLKGSPTTILLRGNSKNLHLPAKWMSAALDAVEYSLAIDPSQMSLFSRDSQMMASKNLVMANVPSMALAKVGNPQSASPLEAWAVPRFSFAVHGKSGLRVSALVDLHFRSNIAVDLVDGSVRAKLDYPGASLKVRGGPNGKNKKEVISTEDTLLSVVVPTQTFKRISKSHYQLQTTLLDISLTEDNKAAISRLLRDVLSNEKSYKKIAASGFFSLKCSVGGTKMDIRERRFDHSMDIPDISSLMTMPMDDSDVSLSNPRLTQTSNGVVVEGAIAVPTELRLDLANAVSFSLVDMQNVVVGSADILNAHSGRELPIRMHFLDSTPFLAEALAGRQSMRVRVEAPKGSVFAPLSGLVVPYPIRLDRLLSSTAQRVKSYSSGPSELQLLESIELVSSHKAVWPETYMTIRNPFSVPITILAIKGVEVRDSLHDLYITTVDEPNVKDLSLPPNQVSRPKLPFASSYKGDPKDGLKLLPDLLHRRTLVSMTGVVRVRLGSSFEVDLPYAQSSVPLTYSVHL